MGVVQFDEERLRRLITQAFPEAVRRNLADASLTECVELLVRYAKVTQAKNERLEEILANMEYDADTVRVAKTFIDAYKALAGMCSGGMRRRA